QNVCRASGPYAGVNPYPSIVSALNAVHSPDLEPSKPNAIRVSDDAELASVASHNGSGINEPQPCTSRLPKNRSACVGSVSTSSLASGSIAVFVSTHAESS